MASTHKHIRSGTANKRPTTAIADGQIALNTNLSSPGLFFKDSTGAEILKIGPVHVGATAPNASPAGSAGNSTGEIWLDTSLTPVGVKIWNGSAFVNATPIGSTTVQGLLELATDAETQAGADTARAVTSASLQSKLSDSTSTTSNTTIASSTAVKAAYDLANAALPKTGGTVTGNLEIGTAGSLTFEGATADGFETTIAVVDPTADRTITLPNTTGTVVTTGDSGTVTSTMLLDGTIVDADINASAAIAYSKLATLTSANIVLGSSANVATSTAVTGDVTIGSTGVTAIAAGVIVNADVNASAAIAGTKIAPDFGAQNIATTGSSTAATFNPTGTTPSVTGIYSPGANRLGITTNTVERVEFGTSEVVFNDDAADYDFRIEGDTNSNLFFADASAEAVGIRTATPVSELNVSVGNGGNITISNTNDAHSAGLAFGDTTSNSSGRISYDHSTNALAVATNGTQRITIDSSGRLLVGTATARSKFQISTGFGNVTPIHQFEFNSQTYNGLSITHNAGANTYPAVLAFGKSRGSSADSYTAVASGDGLGWLDFYGADGTNMVRAATISAEVDGTPGANDMPGRLVFSTTADGGSSPSERLRITSAGLVGIGTSSPLNTLNIVDSASVHNGTIRLGSSTYYSTITQDAVTTGKLAINSAAASGSAHGIQLQVDGTAALAINSSRQVGIGTTSPAFGAIDHGVHIYGSGAQEGIRLETTNGSSGILEIYAENGGSTLDTRGSGYIRFNNAATEFGRWDSSGRLLVGTSTALANVLIRGESGVNTTITPRQQIAMATNTYSSALSITNYGTSGFGGTLSLNSSGSNTLDTNALVSNATGVGVISFNGNDGTNFVPCAQIVGTIDGTPGANDMPGRLVFSTTADGAASPTERMRIPSGGGLFVGKQSESFSTAGFNTGTGGTVCARTDLPVLYVSRISDDGTLVSFYQGGTEEGTISVSGTTVSYNGAHLSRWSQLPSGAERTEILRGTVLSNIDEMCEWGNEENEQLNRMNVSDVEGDKNVSGVFQCWDDDDDTYINDFYCAMTGDFIIRIAEGTTVERGDLLMSAGDGTAKPQDDDIIRSKTIAKVTSTNVSCTYEDGSYCVPCVLMAC